MEQFRESLQFQNIYRMKTRQCPSVLNTKAKSTRFAGASIDLFARHANYSHGAKQRSLLPHVFAVFGVVCGGNTNENENSAKSGISQDATPPVRIVGRPTSSRCTNGRFGKMKQQKNIGPMREGLKSWRLQETPTTSTKRKLVLESATDENEPPPQMSDKKFKGKVQFFKQCSCSREKYKSSSEVSKSKSHVMNFFIGYHVTRRVCSSWNPPY